MSINDGDHRPRQRMPNCEAAASFQLNVCGDPECGLHLFGLRRNGKAFSEVVIGRDQIPDLLKFIRDEGLDI